MWAAGGGPQRPFTVANGPVLHPVGDDEDHRCTWTSSGMSGTRRRWCWCRTRPPWRRSRRGGGARSSSSMPRPRRSPSATGTTGDRGGRAAGACGRSGARARLPRDSERVKRGARVEALRLPVADAWLPARYTASPIPFLEGDALTGPGSRASHRAPAEPGLGPCGLRSLSRAPRRPHVGSRVAWLRGRCKAARERWATARRRCAATVRRCVRKGAGHRPLPTSEAFARGGAFPVRRQCRQSPTRESE